MKFFNISQVASAIISLHLCGWQVGCGKGNISTRQTETQTGAQHIERQGLNLDGSDTDEKIAVNDFTPLQWDVASELEKLLPQLSTFSKPVLKRGPDNCPPESVIIGGKRVTFTRGLEDDSGALVSDNTLYRWEFHSPDFWDEAEVEIARTIERTSGGAKADFEDHVEAQIARLTSGQKFVIFVPIELVDGLSHDCAQVSKITKRMEPLVEYEFPTGIVDWYIERSGLSAIRLGISVLRALEGIHSAGLVFGLGDIHLFMHYRPIGSGLIVPAWQDRDVLALDSLQFAKLFVDPVLKTHKSPSTRLEDSYNVPMVVRSPAEICGYSPFRIDDLYRLSETLFEIWGFTRVFESLDPADLLLAKKDRPFERDTRLKRIITSEYDEKYYKVLKAFHDSMYELSVARYMGKPDYQDWIDRFEAALHQT